MNNVMLDLETMGTSSNSAIVSIGAVAFNLDTGETGEEFYASINLESCIRVGLEIDASTLMWWMQQDDDARGKISNGGSELLITLRAFGDFMQNKKHHKIWGNSASFDCGILSNAFNKCDELTPWKFYNERDVRTLVSFNPNIKKNVPFEGVKHSPIDDCKHQIKYCSAIWKSMNVTR